MRILLVHNFYGSEAPSGENVVYQAERDLLVRRGHVVREVTRHSDAIRHDGLIGLVKGGIRTPWSCEARHGVADALKEFQPQIMHVHNTFPLLSPSVFYAASRGPATILTLHNYRLCCAAGVPMKDGIPCTLCLDRRSVVPALRYGCYRGSRLATVPLAASIALHRLLQTWTRRVTVFIALSEFQKRKMTAAGLPAHRIAVKPNFFPGNPEPIPWAEREDTVVFAGRLTEEKGVRELILAWTRWGPLSPVLEIIGDGPLMPEFRSMVESARSSRIRFTGFLSSSATEERMKRAKLVVLPSKCFEGFPLVVREAFAFGTPVAVSALGPLPEIVNNGVNGVLFRAGDPSSILGEIRKNWMSEGIMTRLSRGSRDSFERLYSEDANYRILMSIYEKALLANQAALGRAADRCATPGFWR
jgi:glycosyltransferase involved in cell wall biosynthesis